MVARDILYLTIFIFFDAVAKNNFVLLSVGWYLFRVVHGNRYLPRDSNENALCITNTGMIFAVISDMYNYDFYLICVLVILLVPVWLAFPQYDTDYTGNLS